MQDSGLTRDLTDENKTDTVLTTSGAAIGNPTATVYSAAWTSARPYCRGAQPMTRLKAVLKALSDS